MCSRRMKGGGGGGGGGATLQAILIFTLLHIFDVFRTSGCQIHMNKMASVQ